jgi:predicted nucleic acid-binding protein
MGVTVVDAGVVIAFLDERDVHHAAARAGLDEARDRGDLIVLPASAYSETLVSASRAGDAAVRIVDALVDGLPMTVEAIGRAIAGSAAGLRAHHGRGLRLPDALVLATAQVLGADRVLTTDSDLQGRGVDVELIRGA